MIEIEQYTRGYVVSYKPKETITSLLERVKSIVIFTDNVKIKISKYWRKYETLAKMRGNKQIGGLK